MCCPVIVHHCVGLGVAFYVMSGLQSNWPDDWKMLNVSITVCSLLQGNAKDAAGHVDVYKLDCFQRHMLQSTFSL